MIDIFPKYELCWIMLLAILNATIKQTFTPNVALSSTILHQHVHDSSHMSHEQGAKQPWKWRITAPHFDNEQNHPTLQRNIYGVLWFSIIWSHVCWPLDQDIGERRHKCHNLLVIFAGICATRAHISASETWVRNHGAFQGRTTNDFSTKDPHGGWVLFPSYVGLQSPHFGSEKLHKGTRWITCCLVDTW